MESATPDTIETILIVDDEPAILDLVSQVLEKQGYLALQARTPRAALRICEAHPGPIHLLLTDLLMPEMNGLELATRVVGLRPLIRVLFMSESGLVADAFAGEQDATFLTKPFSIGDLVNTVASLVTPPGKKGTAENRESELMTVRWPIEFSGEEMVGEGLVIELSKGGCCAESDIPPPSGTYLKLRVSPPDHDSPIEVELARVQWCRGRRFGAEFVRVDEKHQTLLRRLLLTPEAQKD